ncbi:MAG: nitroreductase family protein [Tenericutes bacterium]|nr:nitroreductase family protein [Mycoplasmatota bacterium]
MSDLINKLKQRRSYREFETESFDIEIIISAIEAAKYAPNGANKQPWTFCVVKDPEIKKQIRKESEAIECDFYKRLSKEWANDLVPLNVDISKPFLEKAPYLIVIFKHTYELDQDGNKSNVYFPDKSIGIATGMLISVLTDLDIQILTYTPSPDHFLTEILKRPKNEKPYMILVCGKGSKDYSLPNITKKSNSEIIKIY